MSDTFRNLDDAHDVFTADLRCLRLLNRLFSCHDRSGYTVAEYLAEREHLVASATAARAYLAEHLPTVGWTRIPEALA